jgi:hypothetical protein
MVDSGNQDVKWGQAASQVNVTDGETDIDFVAYLRANNASAAVTPGDFEFYRKLPDRLPERYRAGASLRLLRTLYPIDRGSAAMPGWRTLLL